MTARTEAPPEAGQKLEPLFATKNVDDKSSHRHRQFIGYLGLALPAVLYVIASLRPSGGVTPWQPLDSVSAYYYTGAVAAFVGILVALGAFLFTYRGYDNSDRNQDRIAALIAGTAAVLVALFPAGSPKGMTAPPWWTNLTGGIHYCSAVILFGAFIFFSLVLFRKSNVEKEPRPKEKRGRDNVYLSCGIAMVICLVWAGIASVMDASIFWPEALALEFFSVSWLVKGRARFTLVAMGRRTPYYWRNPRRLADDVWSAIRG